MKPFTASSPAVEVNGETVRAIVAGMTLSTSRAHKILSEHGIPDPQPGHWYRQQDWLNAFKAISDGLGASTLFQIGKKVPESAKFPPEIDSVEKALAAINMAYQMNHRGGEIGSYDYLLLGPKKAKVVCRNPYPSDFDRGIIQAMTERFKPSGSLVQVELDAQAPTRKNGAESCTFLVSW